MEKTTLLETLNNTIVDITFTKKDGSDRTMKCTRSLDIIPTAHHPKSDGHYQIDDNIRVFDVDKCAWRSFNFSSVKEYV